MRASIIASAGTILCQGDALLEGFATLGHENVPPDAPDTSFVFVGDPWYDKYLDHEKDTIFNVLDVAWHAPEVSENLDKLRAQLPRASRVTTISATVAAQLTR